MAAATAVNLDASHPEVLFEHLRERGSDRQQRQLHDRIEELECDNGILARRVRELERELLIARLDSGELSPPAAVGTPSEAEVWLLWARRNHHTDACSCHRCAAARRLL